MTQALPTILLDEGEVRALAGGYVRADKQLRELHARGFTRARRSPLSGRIVLERSHYLAVTVGTSQREAQNVPRPNWTRRRHMGRRRERVSGMGLLPRMEAVVGKTVTSYRYHPVQGKPIPLGRDRQAAIRRVLDLEGKAPDAGSLRWVWDKYKVSPRFVRLALATLGGLRAVLGRDRPDPRKMPIGSLRSTDIARYMRVERASAPSRANHEKALLSNPFFHGIDLGLCTDNPARVGYCRTSRSRARKPRAGPPGDVRRMGYEAVPAASDRRPWRPALHR